MTKSMTLNEYEAKNGKVMKAVPEHPLNGKRVTVKAGATAKGMNGKNLIGGLGTEGYVWTVINGKAMCHFGPVGIVQIDVSAIDVA